MTGICSTVSLIKCISITGADKVGLFPFFKSTVGIALSKTTTGRVFLVVREGSDCPVFATFRGVAFVMGRDSFFFSGACFFVGAGGMSFVLTGILLAAVVLVVGMILFLVIGA